MLYPIELRVREVKQAPYESACLHAIIYSGICYGGSETRFGPVYWHVFGTNQSPATSLQV